MTLKLKRLLFLHLNSCEMLKPSNSSAKIVLPYITKEFPSGNVHNKPLYVDFVAEKGLFCGCLSG